MAMKDISRNGNIPQVPEGQAGLPLAAEAGNEVELPPVEAELPPAEEAGNEVELPPVEAELPPAAEAGNEVELPPVEAELPPAAEAGNEVELPPVEAELPPAAEAGNEVELPPVEAELPSSENDIPCHEVELPPVEAELLPSENKAVGYEDELSPVEAKSQLPINDDSGEVKGLEAEIPPVEEKLSPPVNDAAGKAERRKPITRHPIEIELYRGSPPPDSYRDPLEDADESESNGYECGQKYHLSPGEKERINPEKEPIFERFLDDEYDQARAPIQGRRRHCAEVQRHRRRHVSADSERSDPNPLGFLQDVGTSGGPVLNQAGAIIGKYIPNEEIPEYARFGTEFGQSLPLAQRNDGSDHSIGSASTAPIGEVYGGTFSVISEISYDSREWSEILRVARQGLSRPQTPSSNNPNTPPPDSNSSEDDKQPPTAADSRKLEHEKPACKRLDAAQPIRSKSALAGLSAYATESHDKELQEGKISSDMSVRSEPLPDGKIYKDSSEQMSLEEINCKELAPLQSASCVPIVDIDISVENLQENLDSLTISDSASATIQNVPLEETEASEDPMTGRSSSPGTESTRLDSE